METTSTYPNQFELNPQRRYAPDPVEDIIIRQYRHGRETSTKHGLPFLITIRVQPDGTIEVYYGAPAGKVKG